MSTQRRVPDLYVEQLAAGELSEARAREVRAWLEAEPGGLERLAEVERSNHAIREALPAAQVTREVRARVAERDVQVASNRPRWLLALPALVAAAAVLLTVRVGPGPLPGDLSEHGIRTKGLEPSLVLYREGDQGPLPTDGVARDGDRIQVTYLADGARHGVIFSIDGRGVVTLHHPPTADGSTALEPTGEIALDHSYELDDAPAHETFVLLVSDAPIDVDAVLRAARSKGLAASFVDSRGDPLDPVVKRVRKGDDR